MSRFIMNCRDGYLDIKTGLLWQFDSFGPITWLGAQHYVKSLGNGWRLPTIHELFALIDLETGYSELPNMSEQTHWSSSIARSNEVIWCLNVGEPHIYCRVSEGQLVRCVHDGLLNTSSKYNFSLTGRI